MARQSSSEPKSRRHIMLYEEDWEFLSLHFGASIGPGNAVCDIVHAHIAGMKAKAAAKHRPISGDDLEI